MTPEQEQKFEGLFSKLSEKQEQLGALVLQSRTDSEDRDRKLANAIIFEHEKTREDVKLRFDTLENMFEQLRKELIGLLQELRKDTGEYLQGIRSDVLNAVNKGSFLSEQIESALATGASLTEKMGILLDEVKKLRKGVAATYNRSGSQNPDASSEIEANESPNDRGRRI